MLWLQILRLSVLIWAAFCGVIVIGLGGHLISLAEEYLGGYPVYGALGVATGVIALVSLLVMIILDFVLSTFTSWIVVELTWLTILWVLFLATGADAASALSDINNTCDFIYTQLNTACHETQALTAFAFLAWIALMLYTVILLILAILNRDSSVNVWTSSVKDSFGDAPTKSGNQYPMTTSTGAAPSVQPHNPTQTV